MTCRLSMIAFYRLSQPTKFLFLQIMEHLKELSTLYPDILTLHVIGETFENRSITLVQVISFTKIIFIHILAQLGVDVAILSKSVEQWKKNRGWGRNNEKNLAQIVHSKFKPESQILEAIWMNEKRIKVNSSNSLQPFIIYQCRFLINATAAQSRGYLWMEGNMLESGFRQR